jgi:hypothetical protein
MDRIIVIRFSTIDGFRKTRKFKTLAGAQRFAQKYVGKTPEISEAFQYAVGSFGDAKITVISGAVGIRELFPATSVVEAAEEGEEEGDFDV